MGFIKNTLIWTNPLTYVFGVPIFVGFVLVAMLDGIVEKTNKIVKSINF
ncbi:hypothetical protein HY498_05085 [Candidatus Woesearchaeota archaeon]|nr:hypothetical protein [Candidatus Woesearchaeota archaeon]